ncbi:chondroitin proteoglycan 2 [Nephila pilipes]|uniref:Chondroitin proteoglycan 2 n=1 Tax=Nephila pilipes TaxID=299642 RepID=A0A8X6QHH5_NEPPI|nr:chondroitin proteoglycan 2 [Nephila pilipes]
MFNRSKNRFSIFIGLSVFASLVAKGATNPVINRQCRAGVCDDRPECPKTSCRCIYPSKIDCALYYQCVQGKPIQYRCSPGLLFNADALTCDYDFNVNCTVGLSTTSSSSSSEALSTTTTNSKPQSSTSPSTTINEETTPESSVTNEEVTTKTSTSDIPETAFTGIDDTSTSEAITVLPTKTTNKDLPDSSSETPNSKYPDITTERIHSELPDTSSGTTNSKYPEMSTETTRSEPPDTSKTTDTNSDRSTNRFTETATEEMLSTRKIPPEISTTKQPSNWTCPSRFGLFPDPEDCNKYYHCSQWEPVHEKCDSGLHFNPIKMLCDWPDRAGCDYQTTLAPTESQYTQQTNFTEISTKHFSTEAILNETTSSEPIATDSSVATDKIITSSNNDHIKTITTLTTELPFTNHSSITEMTVSTEIPTTVSFTSIETTLTDTTEVLATSERELSSETTSSRVKTTISEISTGSGHISTKTETTLLPKTETTSDDSSSNSSRISTENEPTSPTATISTSNEISTETVHASTEKELSTTGTNSEEASTDSDRTSTDREPTSPAAIITSDEISAETIEVSTEKQQSTRVTTPETSTNSDHISSEEPTSAPTTMTSDEISTEKKPTPTTGTSTTSDSISSSSSLSTEKVTTSIMTSSDEVNTNSTFSSTMIETTLFTTKETITTENASTTDIKTSIKPTSEHSTSTETSFTTMNNDSTISTETSTGDAIKTTTLQTKTTGNDEGFNCPTRFGLFPDSKNCTRFYQCSHWKEHHKKCPSNLHFNPDLQVCDWPYRAGCEVPSSTTITVQSTTPSKPDFDNDTDCICDSCELPVPDDCNSYILCIDRKAIPISCGSELNFNPMTGTCDLEENVQCEENVKCPEPTGRFPYPHSCKHFMDCKDYEMTIKKCPEDMIYDVIAETCSWSGSCENNKTSTEKPTSATYPDTTISNASKDVPESTETATELFTTQETSTSSKHNDDSSTPKLSSLETTKGETSSNSFTTTEIPPSKNNTNDYSTESSSSPKDEETTTNIFSTTNTERTKPPNTIRTTSSEENISTTISPLTSKDITDPANESITSEDTTEVLTSTVMFTSSESATSTVLPESSTVSVPETLPKSTPQNISITPTHETTTKSSSDFLCPSRFGLFPDPENCFRFYHCSQWKPHHKWCPSGLHFNPGLQVCDWPYRAGCGGSFEIITPDPNQGKDDPSFNETCDCECCFYPDKKDCSKYMLCLGGVLHKGQCAEGLLFDSVGNNCDLEDRVKCPSTTICASPSGIYPHPSNCSLFYRCNDGRPNLEKCLDNKHFSTASKKCTEPCEAKCEQNLNCVTIVPPPVVSDSSICIEGDGLYPVKNDCSIFYQCTNGYAYFVRCPDGLHFNVEYGVCELPCDAKCDPELDCLLSSAQVNSKSFNIPTFHCPRPNGLFPAPQSCSSYYLCSRANEHLLFCPPGLHYNTVRETCETPCEAQCDKSIECPHPNLPKNKEVTETSLLVLPIKLRCKSSIGKFSNPKDCASFYTCLDGKAHLEFCSNGLHFDPEDKECKSPCVAGCDTSLECPEEIPQTKENCSCENCFLPVATDCSAYYFCSQNYLTKGYCPYGTLFDRQTSQCQNQSDVICDSVGDPALCHEPYGIFPYPGNCKKFVHCIDSVAHIQDCEDSLEFDPKIRTCTNPKGYCGVINKDPLCELADGLVAHETNCSRFYQCENWTAYLKSCPAPLIFNAADQICDWPHNFKCNTSKALINNAIQDNKIKLSANSSSSQSNKASLHSDNSTTHACETVPGVICPCACRVTTYDDCISFYHCRGDGKACKRYCPQGLYFNKKTMVCDLPHNVECRDFFFTTLKIMKSWNSAKVLEEKPFL